MKEHSPSKLVDFVRFFLNFEELIGKLRPVQIRFFEMMESHKRICALWCRQTGKSTSVAAGALSMALMNRNFKILIAAPSRRQSSETFEKMRFFITENPHIMDYCVKFTQTEIKFSNGSRIVCVPIGALGKTIRGFTADILIIEESGYIRDSIVTGVLMPMIAHTNGLVIKIGTPFGKNHFHESCFGADTTYKLLFYDYNMALKDSVFTEEFIEEMRRTSTTMEFRTEWEALFIEEADCYFSTELIKSCFLDYGFREIRPDEIAELSVHPKSVFTLGSDLARMGEDSTVNIIVEKPFLQESYRLSHLLELNKKPLTEAGGVILSLYEKFRFIKIIPDETGLGAGVTDFLKEILGNDKWKVEPISFTVDTKMDLYSNLKMMMQRGLLKIPNHKKLIFQLLDFRYEITSNGKMKLHHPEKGHDDYCDALALAVWPFRPVGGKPLFMIR